MHCRRNKAEKDQIGEADQTGDFQYNVGKGSSWLAWARVLP